MDACSDREPVQDFEHYVEMLFNIYNRNVGKII